jgi:hypothetical protein
VGQTGQAVAQSRPGSVAVAVRRPPIHATRLELPHTLVAVTRGCSAALLLCCSAALLLCLHATAFDSSNSTPNSAARCPLPAARVRLSDPTTNTPATIRGMC